MHACIYNYSSYIIDFLHAMHMCNYNLCTHVCRHTRKHSILCLIQVMASRNIHAPPVCRAYVTSSAKTLHVCVFYTLSQKQLLSLNS